MKSVKTVGFVLRKRPFKENDFLVDLFTRDLGLITIYARAGSRSKNRSRLELFSQANWYLKEGKTFYFISDYEFSYSYHLVEQKIWIAYYLNELLLRLFPYNQEDSILFNDYLMAIHALSKEEKFEAHLRNFEASLLQFLGVYPDFENDNLGHAIEKSQSYYLHYSQGLSAHKIEGGIDVSGFLLLKMAKHEELSAEETLQHKHIMRYLILPLLGDEPLQSRIWLRKLYFQ